jgi:hypothetical protein
MLVRIVIFLEIDPIKDFKIRDLMEDMIQLIHLIMEKEDKGQMMIFKGLMNLVIQL